MKDVVRKEKLLRYLAKIVGNGHPQELGGNSTKVVAISAGLPDLARYHHLIILEDVVEG